MWPDWIMLTSNGMPNTPNANSKLRWAQCEEPVERQAKEAVLFRRPSRGCTRPNGKIKTRRRIQFWRRPIDSLAPARSPAALAGLTVYLAVPTARFSARVGDAKTKRPAHQDMLGALFWRRPTLAQPIAVLPSGLQRFTAVFGMGTGGATARLSPEACSDFRSRLLVRDS